MNPNKNFRQIVSLLKQAKMIVMQNANAYTEHWHFCFPSQRLDEEVGFCTLGSSPALGFIVLNESNGIIKAFDKDMNLLVSLGAD